MNERKVSIAALLSVTLVAVVTLLLAVFAAFFYATERAERKAAVAGGAADHRDDSACDAGRSREVPGRRHERPREQALRPAGAARDPCALDGRRARPRARAAAVAGRGVSFELGLQRCMGRVELYDRILGRFLATRLGDPADVRDALARHQPERAAAIAHSLISTAGAIGAEGLSEASRALQRALEAGESARLPALLDDFTERHAAVVEAVRRHVANQRAAGRGVTPG